ncbi:MAG: putative sensor protein [Firmicutes bacterium]|nr:putative sensor protein [Bacillota bacterium]
MLKTVLVDDERPSLKALEHLLKQYSNIEIVGSFTDIDQALELVKCDPIHLLFLDIDMPKLNGIGVAKKIFGENSTIEIVFVTAYNQFAVDAFEVNAIDYIMKPVSKKRLDRTIERIVNKKLSMNPSIVRQNQTDFLNQLLTQKFTDPDDILQRANLLGIDFSQSFSLYFLLITDGNRQSRTAFIEKISTEHGLIAWETPQGICILDYTLSGSTNHKNQELESASNLKAIAATYFPETKIVLGIAEHYPETKCFANRYVQARNAAVIGMHMSQSSGVYHFLDSGFLPVLDQYVNKHSIDNLIDNTIGKILEYDRINDTELFRTMEKIVFNNTLQDVANTLFIHYKTVLFRKQSIEKILGTSINSFAGRTMLGVALTLYYLRNIPTINAKSPPYNLYQTNIE